MPEPIEPLALRALPPPRSGLRGSGPELRPARAAAWVALAVVGCGVGVGCAGDPPAADGQARTSVASPSDEVAAVDDLLGRAVGAQEVPPTAAGRFGAIDGELECLAIRYPDAGALAAAQDGVLARWGVDRDALREARTAHATTADWRAGHRAGKLACDVLASTVAVPADGDVEATLVALEATSRCLRRSGEPAEAVARALTSRLEEAGLTLDVYVRERSVLEGDMRFHEAVAAAVTRCLAKRQIAAEATSPGQVPGVFDGGWRLELTGDLAGVVQLTVAGGSLREARVDLEGLELPLHGRIAPGDRDAELWLAGRRGANVLRVEGRLALDGGAKGRWFGDLRRTLRRGRFRGGRR